MKGWHIIIILVLIAGYLFYFRPDILNTISGKITSIANINECPVDSLKNCIKTGVLAGYDICYQSVPECRSGTEAGENVNYNYCEGTTYNTLYPNIIFCYKKTITSSSGNIEKVILKCVDKYVIDPKTRDVISINCVNPPDYLIGC